MKKLFRIIQSLSNTELFIYSVFLLLLLGLFMLIIPDEIIIPDNKAKLLLVSYIVFGLNGIPIILKKETPVIRITGIFAIIFGIFLLLCSLKLLSIFF